MKKNSKIQQEAIDFCKKLDNQFGESWFSSVDLISEHMTEFAENLIEKEKKNITLSFLKEYINKSSTSAKRKKSFISTFSTLSESLINKQRGDDTN
jgi:hypothetical protein